MNTGYLYSIINLYQKKEIDNKRTILNIKKINDNVEFSFNMKNTNDDKTTFLIPLNDYNLYYIDLFKTYKDDLMIIDEKYNYDNVTNTCYYYVLFNSGRSISFNGFSIVEMNNVRNVLYDIKINKNEVRLDSIEKEKEMAYKPRLRLAQAGFSSYATLFFVVIFFLAVLIISLFVFKSFIN
jgi:hypothetical protein